MKKKKEEEERVLGVQIEYLCYRWSYWKY